MFPRPDDSTWPGRGDLLPPELLHTQEWLHEMFKQAGRGLPWPHQMSLLLVEQAIMIGMFGGLLASAWHLTQQRQGPLGGQADLDLLRLLAQLDGVDTLPEPLRLVINQLRSQLEGQPFAFAAGDWWDELWRTDQSPYPPSGLR